jgi:hypothetical protein
MQHVDEDEQAGSCKDSCNLPDQVVFNKASKQVVVNFEIEIAVPEEVVDQPAR